MAAILICLALTAAPAATAGPAGAADPSDFGQQMLTLVNRARDEQGLPALAAGAVLDRIARGHAQDMLRRDYYAHQSPEGENVRDRYLAAGGSRWHLVAENIARCSSCDPPATAATIEALQSGWLDSPEHRANILRPGLEHFGFGLAVDDRGGLYAVQTFAGPGSAAPGGIAALRNNAAATPSSDPLDEPAAQALDLVNAARREAGVAALAASPVLDGAAEALLPPPGAGDEFRLARSGLAALPAADRRDWASLSALAGECGGCGTETTAADLRFFRSQWLDSEGHADALLDARASHFGFAIRADGRGRKTAVAVIGRQR